MSGYQIDLGMPEISLSIPDESVSLPSLSGATVTVGETEWLTRRKQNNFKSLSGDYEVGVLLMGYDPINGGYCLGEMSDLSDTITVAAGEGIRIEIASLPTDMVKALAAVVYLKKGTADPQQTAFAYIDNTGNRFSYMLRREAPLGNLRVPTAILTDASETTSILKNRNPVGAEWTVPVETTDVIEMSHTRENAQYRPNSSRDTQIPMGTSSSIRYSIYARGMEDLVDALGGDYVKYLSGDSSTIELMDSDYNLIASMLEGNRAYKVFSPPDKQGRQIETLQLASTTTNIADVVESFRKGEVVSLQVEYAPIAFDDHLKGMEGGLKRRRTVA